MSTKIEDLEKEVVDLKLLLERIYDSVWVFGLDKSSQSVSDQMAKVRELLK